MRIAVFVALVLTAGTAHAQKIRMYLPSSGGGMCTLDPTSDAIAVRYRATATTGTGFQSDSVLACALDTGPGARNCIGTNVSGEILLGPDSGSGTIVRLFGDLNALNVNPQNVNASNVITYTAALNQGNTGFMQNTNLSKPVLVTDPEGFNINSTTSIRGWVQLPVTVDFASISNNACATQSVAVAGANTKDSIWANADFALPLGVSIGNVRVTAANTVELTLCNVTAGGALDPSAGDFIFRMSR